MHFLYIQIKFTNVDLKKTLQTTNFTLTKIDAFRSLKHIYWKSGRESNLSIKLSSKSY